MVAVQTIGNGRSSPALAFSAGRHEGWEVWSLRGLRPTPEEDWHRLREFLALDQSDYEAMLYTVEPLLQRAHELVISTYEHLLRNPETAAVLGWETGADPKQMAEQRRSFNVWLARLLGLDLSDDFARYLFRAGQQHAAHGPRQIDVPGVFVAGTISLVHEAFARFLTDAMPTDPVVPSALAAWNKVLTMHLHIMLAGDRSARDVDSGDFPVEVRLFGQVRIAAQRQALQVWVRQGACAGDVLRKFFNYYPHLRDMLFEAGWEEREATKPTGTPWLELERVYTIKTRPSWRALLNGRNLSHIGGPGGPVSPGDVISLFSPGR